MDLLLKIAGLILKETGNLVMNDFYWIVLIIIIFMYRKSGSIELAAIGKKLPLYEKLYGSVLIGLMGGLLGSLLVVFLGITIESYTTVDQGALYSGILYLWIIAVLLSFIDPRYLCFSYSGGIVALANLLIGFPNIYVPGLLALIGILHLIESFLIWLDGYTYAVPMLLKRKNGDIVGGYMMNKMWAVPMLILAVGLTAAGSNSILDSAGKVVAAHMPAWWPIIRQPGMFDPTRSLAYLPLLVPVILGYGDMAITKNPEKRCSDSAKKLALYSCILILLAVISSFYKWFGIIAAIYTPLAHEMLIIRGKKEEEEGVPAFAPAENGLRVLYARKDSPADKMKLLAGDVIMSINNNMVSEEKELIEFLSYRPTVIWMNIKGNDGTIRTVEYSDYIEGVTSLGALIVSKNADLYFEINEGGSFLKRMIDRLRKRRK